MVDLEERINKETKRELMSDETQNRIYCILATDRNETNHARLSTIVLTTACRLAIVGRFLGENDSRLNIDGLAGTFDGLAGLFTEIEITTPGFVGDKQL